LPQEVLTRYLERLAALIWEGREFVPKVDRDFFDVYKQAFREALESGFRAAGIAVDYGSPDMLRLAVMEANTFRFAVAKSATLVKTLSTYARKAETFNEFRRMAEALSLKFNKRYLETEYNFAQAVGQNGAKYQRQMKEKKIFPYLRYSTVGDERVRDAHRVLDGKIFEVGSKAHDIIQAPNGWGCRCELNQIGAQDLDGKKAMSESEVIEALKSVQVTKTKTEWDIMKAGGFNVNRGKIGEVFREKELYTEL